MATEMVILQQQILQQQISKLIEQNEQLVKKIVIMEKDNEKMKVELKSQSMVLQEIENNKQKERERANYQQRELRLMQERADRQKEQLEQIEYEKRVQQDYRYYHNSDGTPKMYGIITLREWENSQPSGEY